MKIIAMMAMQMFMYIIKKRGNSEGKLYMSLENLVSTTLMIQDGHKFKEWEMGTYSQTKDVYIKDLPSYTI
ncbi:hypothetical protein U0X36_05735 [Bacillus thuringiensis]|uniref:hypothetical protein n=1 Tax=Bacillus thuringiensis TaxID=1428 RepID=UPI000E5125B1|nr:hypothetical protein [Bacillus thuringiensis]MDZ3952441.1 hypothetical protein [Bacillus thuringiensis]RGP45258.1 hypothetical protein BTW32_26250 [Bacillus thuringiensis]